ncbi:MAG: hypothetical protein A2293_15150 [Elusimicrobia bacterium RIFOXYB2_FULL_49_7]|nr:MAG: hypothetical protein A2293_15150 [Elusimicrobia bacterium RIFOXYB2_FULL_49_7]
MVGLSNEALRICLAETKRTLSRWRLLTISFSVLFYDLFIPRPFSVLIKWHRLAQAGICKENVAIGMARVRTLQLVLRLILGGAGLGLVFRGHLNMSGLIVLAAIIVGLLVVNQILFDKTAIRAFLIRLSCAGGKRAHTLRYQVVRRWIRHLYRAVVRLAAISRREKLALLIQSLVLIVLHGLAVWCTARSLGVVLPIGLILLLPTVSYLSSAVPFVIQGLGVRESCFVFFLGQCGVSAEQAILISLIGFGISVIYGIMGGGIEMVHLFFGKKRRQKGLSP